MATRFSPLRFLTRGLGGPAAVIMTGGLLTFAIIEDIRRTLGKSSGQDQFIFEDEMSVYKISAMLVEINSRPLDNVLYNKMSKLIIEKKIGISVDLLETTVKKSEPYRIVIGEYNVKRES